jgi:hypothetical protein
MKTTPKGTSGYAWLLIALVLTVALVSGSMDPPNASARTRPENTEPLAGDPTDTNDGPAPRTASGALKISAVIKPNTPRVTSEAALGTARTYYIALRIGLLRYWGFIR